MKKDEIVVNYYGLFLLYFCNYERKERSMEKKHDFKFGVLVGISICVGVNILKKKITKNWRHPEPGDIRVDTLTQEFRYVTQAVDSLNRIYDTYHQITMADVYESLRIPSVMTDDLTGWNARDEINVGYYRDPKTKNYILVFPHMDF